MVEIERISEISDHFDVVYTRLDIHREQFEAMRNTVDLMTKRIAILEHDLNEWAKKFREKKVPIVGTTKDEPEEHTTEWDVREKTIQECYRKLMLIIYSGVFAGYIGAGEAFAKVAGKKLLDEFARNVSYNPPTAFGAQIVKNDHLPPGTVILTNVKAEPEKPAFLRKVMD